MWLETDIKKLNIETHGSSEVVATLKLYLELFSEKAHRTYQLPACSDAVVALYFACNKTCVI